MKKINLERKKKNTLIKLLFVKTTFFMVRYCIYTLLAVHECGPTTGPYYNISAEELDDGINYHISLTNCTIKRERSTSYRWIIS